jgi:hypothetical protein
MAGGTPRPRGALVRPGHATPVRAELGPDPGGGMAGKARNGREPAHGRLTRAPERVDRHRQAGHGVIQAIELTPHSVSTTR